MKRHNDHGTTLKLEQLEQRDMPSTGLPAAETMLPTMPSPMIELTSFQWGIGRGLDAATSVNGPVGDVRLRRIVSDAATGPQANATVALMDSAIFAARPTESISFNFETITLN
jgi:hypothetical protein